MLCKCYWIVLYIVHFTAFCLGGPFFSGHGVFIQNMIHCYQPNLESALLDAIQQLTKIIVVNLKLLQSITVNSNDSHFTGIN